MTTPAQIRAKTAVTTLRPAEPTAQEAISGPRDRPPDRPDPQNCSAQPLDFHRSPRAGSRHGAPHGCSSQSCIGRRTRLFAPPRGRSRLSFVRQRALRRPGTSLLVPRKAEPSDRIDSGLSRLLLWISSRPERQRAVGYFGGDDAEVDPLVRGSGSSWGEQIAQLRGVVDPVVAVAVVHEQVRLADLAGDLGYAVGELLELVV